MPRPEKTERARRIQTAEDEIYGGPWEPDQPPTQPKGKPKAEESEGNIFGRILRAFSPKKDSVDDRAEGLSGEITQDATQEITSALRRPGRVNLSALSPETMSLIQEMTGFDLPKLQEMDASGLLRGQLVTLRDVFVKEAADNARNQGEFLGLPGTAGQGTVTDASAGEIIRNTGAPPITRDDIDRLE